MSNYDNGVGSDDNRYFYEHYKGTGDYYSQYSGSGSSKLKNSFIMWVIFVVILLLIT